MKKNSFFLFVPIILLLATVFITGCSNTIRQNPLQLDISEVSPANDQQDIPLHAILSWKIPARDEVTCKIFWSTNQDAYNSAFALFQNSFFYFNPDERFLPDQQYFWYVELYADGNLTGRSKVYSFQTQKTAKYRFSFSYPISEGNNERNIWMGVPKVWGEDSNDFLSVTSVSFTPEEFDIYTDDTGNKIVMWDTQVTPAPTYTVQSDIETVERQISPILNQGLIFDYVYDSEIYQRYTASSDFHQSDNEQIIEQALETTEGYENPYHKVIALNLWVRQNIKFGLGEKDALNVLQTKLSDCAGFASLNVAFCRALGIPARMVIGVHSIIPTFYPAVFSWGGDDLPLGTHCWYEVYFEKYGWIQFESTADLYPYDSRLTLSKNPVEINNEIFQWLHLPIIGNFGEFAYQSSPLILKVEEIK